MVSTRQISGSNAQIAEQIQGFQGRILSAILVVEDATTPDSAPPTDAEFAAMMQELQSLAVDAPHRVDYSREAMYTRMPGE